MDIPILDHVKAVVTVGNLVKSHKFFIVKDLITPVIHCAIAFSMQSCSESANQPYADEYHWSVHMLTSAYGHFNDTHLHMVGMQTLNSSAIQAHTNAVA